MSANVFNQICVFCLCVPSLLIGLILFHYQLRRAVWRRKRQQGKGSSCFCASSSALWMTLLFVQVFYRPSVEYVLAEHQDEDVEEDDNGDPATPEKQLNRQLKRIRRGEPVDRLILRQ